MDFPVLLVDDSNASVFENEASLHYVVSRTTDKAIRDRIWERARIFDGWLGEYRVKEIRLRGRERFFGWLRPRHVEAFELEQVGTSSLTSIRSVVVETVLGHRDLWEAALDVDELVEQVRTAEDFPTLIDILGSLS